MKVIFYGTRGSLPIASPASVKAGGNTTCLWIDSPCLPTTVRLVVDAGSGFQPFSKEVVTQGVKSVHVLFTHYHHDHTQGALIAPVTFNKGIKKHLWGPVESEVGPREVMDAIMNPPFHPVPFAKVASSFVFHGIKDPSAKVICFHPKGGFVMMTVEEFERANEDAQQISFGREGNFLIKECLVVRMLLSNHPEYTICYRFEEMPTGKVFVFLTDHENQDGIPNDLLKHLANADLLVTDCQYSRAVYDRFTAGFGHGTPDFGVRLALMTRAKRLGLTHHDPSSTDADVSRILDEAHVAKKTLSESFAQVGQEVLDLDLFTCLDYLEAEV